jgi:preprotein translocase subunit SecB
MKIQLNNWQVKELTFSAMQSQEKETDSFDLSIGNFFPEDKTDSFGVVFEVNVKDKEFNLRIEAAFFFSLDQEITEEFKVSNFPTVNAPAIAFPYLRAFISNITLQSGFKPVILPSINFIRLAEKNTNIKK